MNRILLSLATILMFVLTAIAQQTTTKPADGIPTVETHLKVLSEKLDLTGAQQAKIKPILQELHDATEKLVQDKSLSSEDRVGKVRDSRYKADKEIRGILNDDQKKKLDQLESEPHPELHGNVRGTTQSPAAAPQN